MGIVASPGSAYGMYHRPFANVHSYCIAPASCPPAPTEIHPICCPIRRADLAVTWCVDPSHGLGYRAYPVCAQQVLRNRYCATGTWHVVQDLLVTTVPNAPCATFDE